MTAAKKGKPNAPKGPQHKQLHQRSFSDSRPRAAWSRVAAAAGRRQGETPAVTFELMSMFEGCCGKTQALKVVRGVKLCLCTYRTCKRGKALKLPTVDGATMRGLSLGRYVNIPGLARAPRIRLQKRRRNVVLKKLRIGELIASGRRECGEVLI